MLDFGHPPYAPPACDGIEDITDAWQDETDPLNERGEVCEAHFVDSVTGHGCRCALVAISVTFSDDSFADRSQHIGRELALHLLGAKAVSRVERLRADRLTEARQ